MTNDPRRRMTPMRVPMGQPTRAPGAARGATPIDRAAAAAAYGSATPGAARSQAPQESYKSFSASQLYCPKCKQAMPVREKLLLVLPSGDLYDYTCVRCGESLGSKTAS